MVIFRCAQRRDRDCMYVLKKHRAELFLNLEYLIHERAFLVNPHFRIEYNSSRSPVSLSFSTSNGVATEREKKRAKNFVHI